MQKILDEPNEVDLSDAPMDGRIKGVLAALFLLVLLICGILYQAVSKDRDLMRGDELFAKQNFVQALSYYLKSQKRGSLMARPRLTYRIAISYERLGQCERSVDFFYKLLKEHPGSEWEKKAKQGVLACLVDPVSDRARPGAVVTGVMRARDRLHKGYNRLKLALIQNTSGVSAELERAYQEYKMAHEEYTRSIKEGLKNLDSGTR